MVKKIITWVDLQGRYRVTSPAYNDKNRPGETEDETIARVLVKIKAHYGLPDTHPFHFVEDADQRTRLAECCQLYFRYPVLPDADGRRDARDGAWKMDTDGRPYVDMVKASGIQMDYIRKDRNKKLVFLDTMSFRAMESNDVPEQQRIAQKKLTLRDIPQTFDLSSFTTPAELRAAWPEGL